MSLLETTSDHTIPNGIAYLVECHSCAMPYDATQAAWCGCIAKERTLLCPKCERCFCAADVEYKRNFWTNAPEPLWERKARRTREDGALPPNPEPDAVSRPLVLVVDDDREIRAIASHMIDSLGLGCIHAANGMEALALANSYKPEVVLTDALMPKMDGRELCRKIKAEPDLAGTKVIIMSSVYTSGRFKREALSQFKADEYVAKPIDAERLLALVKWERPNGQPQPAPPAAAVVVGEKPADGALAADAPLAEVRLSVVAEDDQPIFAAPAIVSAPLSESAELPLEEITILQEWPLEEPHRSSLTAADLIHLRALGVDADLTALTTHLSSLEVADLVALHAAGVPPSFVQAIDPEFLEGVTPHDLVLLHSSGCDAESVNVLRGLGYTVAEIVGIGASGVPVAFVRELMAQCDRQFSAAEMMRLHFAGVDSDYIRMLQAHGYERTGVDEWIRLWAAGVSAELVEAAAESFREPSSPTEMIRLRMIGVDAALLRRIAGNG